MRWDERLVLGVPEMDTTHEEFVERVTALPQASDEEFPLLFRDLVEHAQEHFDNEGRLMRACHFPATGEHEGEHQKLLNELNYLMARIALGRLAMARAYVEGLPIWFANHLATMDAALAACIRRMTIGHPV